MSGSESSGGESPSGSGEKQRSLGFEADRLLMASQMKRDMVGGRMKKGDDPELVTVDDGRTGLRRREPWTVPVLQTREQPRDEAGRVDAEGRHDPRPHHSNLVHQKLGAPLPKAASPDPGETACRVVALLEPDVGVGEKAPSGVDACRGQHF